MANQPLIPNQDRTPPTSSVLLPISVSRMIELPGHRRSPEIALCAQKYGLLERTQDRLPREPVPNGIDHEHETMRDP